MICLLLTFLGGIKRKYLEIIKMTSRVKSVFGITLMMILFSCPACLYAAAEQMPDDEVSLKSARRWDSVMEEFRRWDSENTFPQDAILFIGSSSINLWKTRECFPDLPVINRGFGGSVYSDIIYWADTLLKPYKPAIIVFYSGDNDPLQGKAPERVFADFKALYSLTQQMYPEAAVIVMATKLSASREKLRGAFTRANRLLRDYAGENANLYYFDSATPLLDEHGNPDPALYKADELHLNEAGYEIWTDNLRVLIDEIIEEDKV
jgi:lysophospholipase L1-like esterase